MYIYIKKLKNDEELAQNIDMPKFLKKIVIKLIKFFNIITVKKIDELHYLYIIPKENIKIIQKIINKNSKEKIILSKELKKYEKELNLSKKGSKIVFFIYDILKYITNNLNIKIELQNIYILANEYNKENIEIIKYLSNKVKTINIVTNNIVKYRKLEEKLYNEEGILITITNNKTKGLKRANFVINLDFDNETIKNYNMNMNSIIINCANNKIDVLKYFQGIIINDIEIKIEEKKENEELYKEFDKTEIYSSFQSKKETYIETINRIKNDKVEVEGLVGMSGNIDVKELLNIRKNLDKM